MIDDHWKTGLDNNHFFWVHGDPYPVTIIRSRYGGIYEGAEWIAFNEHAYSDVLDQAESDDISVNELFNHSYPYPIGRGTTPDEAFASLRHQIRNWTGPKREE